MAATGDDAIRGLFEGWANAIRARDVEGSLAGWAPDVVAFDLISPLQYAGAGEVRERLADWFSSFDGPIGYENRDLRIAAGEDVAFAHSLNHVDATTTDGTSVDMWWRATVCLRKIDGDWRVTHSHASVPLDMETGRAAVDLRP
jgi:uncharacterized protein (TIGR02246 family)